MPYVPLRRHLAAVLLAGLLLLVTAAPAAAGPAEAPRDGRPVVVQSAEPAPASDRERPGRGVTGLLAVIAMVCVLGVSAAAIRTIHAQHSMGTMNP